VKTLKLKGGSLSSTYLIDDGQTQFIRKSVNTKSDREYGYVRWYSQLKKLQRFSDTGVFPRVLNVGCEEDNVYFDIEYLNGYKDIKQIFSEKNLDLKDIEKINDSIWNSFEKIHRKKYPTNKGSGYLYFKEEVLQKITDALKNDRFFNFYQNKSFNYNGCLIKNIETYLPTLEKYFNGIELSVEEDIHGNPTLENMMYSFEEDKVFFIDPYEESCIDTKFLDYCQVLQCSKSYYGYINDNNVMVDGKNISFCGIIPENFKTFNSLFESKINSNKELIYILEATQFIRMLPFKCASGEIDKAIFFYAHSCSLLDKIFDGKCIN